MRFLVGEKIVIRDYSAQFESWCKENLVIPNPEFYKKQAAGRWVGNTPEFIYLYERVGGAILAPFGCLRKLYDKYPGADWVPCFSAIRRFNYQSNINLYDYQQNALNAILARKNGVVVMPCGSGKTQVGLAAVATLGGRALWLTHTKDLLTQSKTRAESVFDNLYNGACGTITGGKVDIGNAITFATIQTLSKLDLSAYSETWDIIIVDECQHAAGSPTRVTQFYKVLSGLCARYKIGLTATPHRADGLEKAMFALLGPVIHEVSRESVADTVCHVKVKTIQTDYFPDCDAVLAGDGTINYAMLVDDLTHDKARFELVFNEIIALDGPAIVLANRVEYLKTLCQKYEEEAGTGSAICLSHMGTTKYARELRAASLAKLDNGELRCIFATYQLAKEGLDVPNLRYVVLATPEKDSTTVMQSAGRVGRKADGKDFGTVIDFEDSFGMYRGWAKKRRGYYKKLGYEILD